MSREPRAQASRGQVSFAGPWSFTVLLVGDFFQPFHVLALARSSQGDVRHRRRRRSAMPVLDAGRTPDVVARADLDDLSAPFLRATYAVRDDETLACRVRVPVRPGARLERDVRAGIGRRFVGRKQRLYTDTAG